MAPQTRSAIKATLAAQQAAFLASYPDYASFYDPTLSGLSESDFEPPGMREAVARRSRKAKKLNAGVAAVGNAGVKKVVAQTAAPKKKPASKKAASKKAKAKTVTREKTTAAASKADEGRKRTLRSASK
jgi:hypothetical protein